MANDRYGTELQEDDVVIFASRKHGACEGQVAEVLDEERVLVRTYWGMFRASQVVRKGSEIIFSRRKDSSSVVLTPQQASVIVSCIAGLGIETGGVFELLDGRARWDE